jgi:anion-transporting  ArsA/GET3 family ATPase
MRAFINAAPALPELSILGKLTSDIRGVIPSDYEVFIVDCYSTGHALSLLRAPRGLKGTFKVGPLNEQASNIDKVISDPTQVHYVVVTIPEEMPMNETAELYKALKTEFNGDITVVCNQIALSGLSSAEESELKKKLKDPEAHEFLEYLNQKEEGQKKCLRDLKASYGEFYGVRQALENVKGQELIENLIPSLEKPWDLTNS